MAALLRAALVVAAGAAITAGRAAPPPPLLAAYDRAAASISFAGETLDLDDAVARLATERDPAGRRSLFAAIASAVAAPLARPVGKASPYAGLLRAAASRPGRSDPFAATARAWGATPDALERRLVRVLEAWRATLPRQEVEPWDWYYAAGDASRILAPALARERIVAAAVRWCGDIGAPLDRLRVTLDLGPAGQSRPPLDVRIVRPPRFSHGSYSGGRYRVTGSLGAGGLDALDALLTAVGGALHVAAIRAPDPEDCRPPADPAFDAALAAMVGDTAYDPAWLERYLGANAPSGDSRRALLAKTMLVLCHALFERRMFAEPAAEPGAVWSAIAERYLGVVPHPEMEWWALSRGLVAKPGTAVERAWGAVVAADLRRRVLALRGPGAFDAPEPGLYVWLVPKLYGFGRAYDGPSLAARFLGRPASIDALVETILSLPPSD